MHKKMSHSAQRNPGFPGAACPRGGAHAERVGFYLGLGLLAPYLTELRLRRELEAMLSGREAALEDAFANYNRAERIQLAEMIEGCLDADLADLRKFKQELMEALKNNPEGEDSKRVNQLFAAIEAIGRACSRIATITKISFSLFNSDQKEKDQKFMEVFENVTGMSFEKFQENMKSEKESYVSNPNL